LGLPPLWDDAVKTVYKAEDAVALVQQKLGPDGSPDAEYQPHFEPHAARSGDSVSQKLEKRLLSLALKSTGKNSGRL